MKKNGGKRINLALQGGGAHGAFTWGVLDGLLSDMRLTIDGVTGASAGAINAVLLADGLAAGGPIAAQDRLSAFWKATSIDGNMAPLQRQVIDRLFSVMPYAGSPMEAWMNSMQRFFSPYDLNPFDINPLQDLIHQFVDFERLAAYDRLQVFIAATNVTTGKLALFSRERMTCKAVMASACLPMLFKAVEIDGVPYWDGGYMGNPPIFPLFRTTEAEDVILVQINPVVRQETPTSSRDIVNRVNEITFNSSLQSELRAVEFVSRLVAEGKLPHGRRPGQYRHVKMHRIALGDAIEGLTASSKTTTDYDFFLQLRDAGRLAAKHFLDTHYDDLGVRSTLDLKAEIAAEKG
ncbi:patatin-like phospholipase family protein [Phreatobacter stygius]|uniref:Patatin-like phospholipase family protein n=1 Tax=Phreatobacter stygius TaxID=1940610 RepID=A0A4D7B343_9HYPH|nr:patatin-like phospholipase family protein [Phreatobacter stygius]QCI64500.1 patatin-like phospholipase family protein [Phreatobacter stygius]